MFVGSKKDRTRRTAVTWEKLLGCGSQVDTISAGLGPGLKKGGALAGERERLHEGKGKGKASKLKRIQGNTRFESWEKTLFPQGIKRKKKG